MSYQFATGFIGGCLVSALMAVSFNAGAKKPGIEVSLTPHEAALLRYCSLDTAPAHKALEEGIREMQMGNAYPVIEYGAFSGTVPRTAGARHPCYNSVAPSIR